jgi:Tfp pilus assembly protein PilF
MTKIPRVITLEYLTEARSSFEQALAIDPKNVEAMSWLAFVEGATLSVATTMQRGAAFRAPTEGQVSTTVGSVCP